MARAREQTDNTEHGPQRAFTQRDPGERECRPAHYRRRDRAQASDEEPSDKEREDVAFAEHYRRSLRSCQLGVVLAKSNRENQDRTIQSGKTRRQPLRHTLGSPVAWPGSPRTRQRTPEGKDETDHGDHKEQSEACRLPHLLRKPDENSAAWGRKMCCDPREAPTTG